MIDYAAMDAVSKAVAEQGQRLVANLNRQCAEATPMQVVAGPIGPARNGVARPVAPEDSGFLEKTGRTLFAPALRLKNETLLHFCARTELSLHEIRTLSRKDLERRIKLRAESRERDYVFEPKYSPIPKKFYVSFDASGNLDAHLAPKLPDNVIDTQELDDLWTKVYAARQ